MVAKEQAREEIRKLVERYKTQSQDSAFVKSERQACDSLILPFFRNVLGWDTEIEFRPEYVQGGKRMDYLVHIDGISQFVVEAKSLSQEIVDNRNFYEQAMHYARQKERRFSILTNFKYWIVLDANIETAPLKAAIAVIDIETLSEAGFEILWSFNRTVWEEKGEANETLLKLKGKQKKKISEELLDDVKKWREQLLTNLKKHPRLNNFDFANDMEKIEGEVQRFIDRLIFICYCEDRQLKDPQLKAIVHEKNGDKWDAAGYVLKKIQGLFQQYRATYNSDLFVAGWCDEFHIDDVVLVDIVNGLKAPADRLPYDFGVIEADILGKAYENFLGHILSGRKNLKEKQSRGKRKEEGIYYTPDYIVEYILKNTLGELLKTKELADLPKIRILDPACGSGSFLTKAFAMMDATHKKKNPSYSTAFMKNQILKNNIFGVDLDSRAVEMSRFHLMLRAAERNQMLPELKDNIKCGNSLIDDPSVAGEKAFRWEDQFRQVMAEGGFDVVVGNPPYEVLAPKERAETGTMKELTYYREKYKTLKGKLNLYQLMIENAYPLMKDGGRFGFIVPNTIMAAQNTSELRKFLLQNAKDIRILEFPERAKVFNNVTQGVCVLLWTKGKPTKQKVSVSSGLMGPDDLSKARLFSIDLNDIKRLDENVMPLPFAKTENETMLLKKLFGFPKIRDIRDIEIFQGEINLTVFKDCVRQSGGTKLVRGDQIARYSLIKGSDHKPAFLDTKRYLKRAGASEKAKHHKRKRLVFQEVANIGLKRRLNGVIVDCGIFLGHTCNYAVSNDDAFLKVLLGIFNSTLLNWRFKLTSVTNHVSGDEIRQLPVPEINLSKAEYKTIIFSVDKMLSLNRRLNEIGSKRTVERERIEVEIRKTDAEIDELVYKLYGITEEEKKIIEESLKRS